MKSDRRKILKKLWDIRTGIKAMVNMTKTANAIAAAEDVDLLKL